MNTMRRIKESMKGVNTKQMINRPCRKEETENFDKAHGRSQFVMRGEIWRALETKYHLI